jgi:hypothetical protein
MRELGRPPAHGIPMGVIGGVSLVLLVGAAAALLVVFLE